MHTTAERTEDWRLDGVENRVTFGFEQTDSRIGRLEDRVWRLEGELREEKARTGRLEFRLNLLPSKAILALLMLAAVGMAIASIALAIAHHH